MIEVTLLGTGSPIPDPQRAGPSTRVRAGGQTFLVDCGRGVLQRAIAVGAGANSLTALLLTHLHSDHIADLGDLLITRWVTTFTAEQTPLPIIGTAFPRSHRDTKTNGAPWRPRRSTAASSSDPTCTASRCAHRR